MQARYACAGDASVALTLSLAGRGPSGAVAAGAFDVSVADPAHLALRDAIAARVRGGARGPMVVRIAPRVTVRHLGSFEIGHPRGGGDDLARSPWLDLPLGLLLALLLARALRPGPSTRVDLAATLAAAVALVVIARRGEAGVAVHTDVVRDLLFARDCVEGGFCHALGPQSSLAVIGHGTLWLRFPEWVARLGGHPESVRALVELAHAVALAALTLGARRHGAGRAAPLVAIAAGVAALWAVHHPLPWHPSIVPLTAALYAVLVRDALRAPTPGSWALAGAALGLLCDAHPAAFVLVPCFVLGAGSFAARPARSAVLAALGLVGALALPSPLLLLARLAWAAGDARSLAMVASLGVAVALAVALRRRATTLSADRTRDLVTGLHAVALVAVALAARQTEARYLAPALPFVTLWFARRVPSVPPSAAALGALVALLAWGRARAATVESWTLADVRAVLASAPLRGRAWVDLAARLHGTDPAGLRAAAGLLVPRPRATDRVGPDSLRVDRLVRSQLPTPVPAGWTVVPLARGDVAVLRALRSYVSFDRLRACVGERCEDVDLGASLASPVASAAPFGPCAYGAAPALVSLAGRAPRAAGQRLQLTLALEVPPGGADHRLAITAGSAWRLDGVTGDVAATPQADGALVLLGARPGRGALVVSMPLAGGGGGQPVIPMWSETEPARRH